MLDLPAHSPVTDKFASTSQTNTSDRTSSYSSSSADLSRILLNIKSSRWRHFRPRTLSLHDEDNTVTDPLFRRLGRGQSRITATLAGTTGPLRGAGHTAPTAAFTAQQYQQHQEQLALMQKQQLEQIQQQQQANSASSTANSTQCPKQSFVQTCNFLCLRPGHVNDAIVIIATHRPRKTFEEEKQRMSLQLAWPLRLCWGSGLTDSYFPELFSV
ncbi:unnamed protein product [Oncorhynchus mykiss]|uniref:Enhancer of polycomb C-terminal domain-containing protein n=1 Tax=Oncorhynchus mykiss TaxID=8022 RepID=A0A060YAV4_ONCMY|nr:unnamed protein product [Oncorhynchus mykiss]